MPKEFDLELVIEKLVFIEKVEDGLKQANNGDVVAHEDVKELANKW